MEKNTKKEIKFLKKSLFKNKKTSCKLLFLKKNFFLLWYLKVAAHESPSTYSRGANRPAPNRHCWAVVWPFCELKDFSSTTVSSCMLLVQRNNLLLALDFSSEIRRNFIVIHTAM